MNRLTRESLTLHDPQTEFRRVPPLFSQEESEDGQAPQSRYVRQPRRSRDTRAPSAVLQTPLRRANAQTRPDGVFYARPAAWRTWRTQTRFETQYLFVAALLAAFLTA